MNKSLSALAAIMSAVIWRVAQALVLISSTHTGQRVPHPCVFCKGGSGETRCPCCVPFREYR